jgi:hypothetical protein
VNRAPGVHYHGMSLGVSMVNLNAGVVVLTALCAAFAQSARCEDPSVRVSISLGTPQQVFHRGEPNSTGLFNVPDMHTALLRNRDGSYYVWITGDVTGMPGTIGIFRLRTSDFIHYEDAGGGHGKRATPVMTPTCRAGKSPAAAKAGRKRPAGISTEEVESAPCSQDYDADYVGANTVLRGRGGSDLLMFYEAGNKSIGANRIAHGWEFNVMALARSSDEGVTWRREGVFLSGSDGKPTSPEGTTSQPGISEPGVIAANGYLYIFYQYVPNSPSSPDAPSVIQVARAPLSGDGKPGSWTKYYQGAFSEPGIGGKGSPVVKTGPGTGCTRPVQVWPAYSEFLHAYVLAYVCNEGWFFSTSTDLTTWSAPANFLSEKMWQRCAPMDWNYVLVTPGKEAGVLGETGYVLYAHTDSKGLGCGGGFSPHMLWIRPFKFVKKE